MCLIQACGGFWDEGLEAQALKCPCGYSHWDIFQEGFVQYGRRRTDEKGRALPMKNEERDIRSRKPEEYEAGMRAQFITHCISCGIRRRLFNEETDVAFDDESIPRAIAELMEISRGDFGSRGSSQLAQTLRRSIPPGARRQSDARNAQRNTDARRSNQVPVQRSILARAPELVNSLGSPPQDSRPARSSREQTPRNDEVKLSDDHNRTTSDPRVTSRYETVDSTYGSGSSTYGIDSTYGTSPRHSVDRLRWPQGTARGSERLPLRTRRGPFSTYEDAPRHEIAQDSRQRRPIDEKPDRDDEVSSTASTQRERGDFEDDEDVRLSSMFIPAKGISKEILDHHRKKGTFGEWISISRGRQSGQEGFLVDYGEDAQPLNIRQIGRLVEESRLYEAKKKETGHGRR